MRYAEANNEPNSDDRAERLLQKSIETVRDNSAGETTPLSFLRTRIEARAAGQDSKETTVMASLYRTVRTHPKISFSLVATICAILFVALVPFSYSTVVGYSVSFDNLAPETALMANNVTKAVKALGYSDISLNFNQSGETFTYGLSGLPTRSAANEAAVVFHAITGSDAEPAIEPILANRSGSLLAQVQDHLRESTIMVDGGQSEAEIEAAIRQQLADQGFQLDNVTITRDGDQTTIQMEMHPTE